MKKRILSLFMAFVMLVSLAACGNSGEGKPSGNAGNDQGAASADDETYGPKPFDPNGEEPDLFKELRDRAETTLYMRDFVQAHLEYIDKAEYKDLALVKGGLSGVLGDTYNESGLNLVNCSWNLLENMNKLLNNSSVDESFYQQLGFENEYDLLVADLMMADAQVVTYGEDPEKIAMDEALSFMQDLSGVMSVVLSTLNLSADDVSALADLNDTIDGHLAELLGTEEEEDRVKLFNVAVNEVQNIISDDLSDEEEGLFKKALGALGYVNDLLELGDSVLENTVEKAGMVMALSKMSDSWCAAWELIADKANAESTPEGAQIAKAITKVLDEVREYTADQRAFYVTSALNNTSTELIHYFANTSVNIVSDALSKDVRMAGVRAGLAAGVWLSDLILGMNDIASSGRLLWVNGNVAKAIWSAMTEGERTLRHEQTYASAAEFDVLFHAYKNIQIRSIDAAINYKANIATAPINYVFVTNAAAQQAEITEIQVVKAQWLPRDCHKERPITYNNGGTVLQCGSVVWALTDNKLVRWDKKKNTVTYANDPLGMDKLDMNCRLWSCNGNIYISSTIGSGETWSVLTTDDGEVIVSRRSETYILGVDETDGILYELDNVNQAITAMIPAVGEKEQLIALNSFVYFYQEPQAVIDSNNKNVYFYVGRDQPMYRYNTTEHTCTELPAMKPLGIAGSKLYVEEYVSTQSTLYFLTDDYNARLYSYDLSTNGAAPVQETAGTYTSGKFTVNGGVLSQLENSEPGIAGGVPRQYGEFVCGDEKGDIYTFTANAPTWYRYDPSSGAKTAITDFDWKQAGYACYSSRLGSKVGVFDGIAYEYANYYDENWTAQSSPKKSLLYAVALTTGEAALIEGNQAEFR